MNKTIPTSKAKSSWKSLLQVPRQDQEGMALVLALLLGMVMMAGVSGLLARQLMSRRLSAKESYQQMAEAAANNGLATTNPPRSKGAKNVRGDVDKFHLRVAASTGSAGV